MARISSYPIDLVVTAKDKWIGTDAAGSITKNFSAEKVAEFLNNTGAIDASWTRYKFKRQATLIDGSFALNPEHGSNPAFSVIQGIQIHQEDLSEKNVSELYSALVGSQVVLQKADNQSKFGVFNWNTSQITSPGSEYYNIGLSFVGGNGTLEIDADYLLSLLMYDIAGISDKSETFVVNQADAASQWVINHSLEKFPSVTVVDSAGNVVYGQVNYVDENTVTVDFGASFSGTAYLN